MDKRQFGQFVMALKTYYPKENLLPNEQAIELWYRQLQDIPYDLAEITLNSWVATNKWSPTIADIRERACEIKLGDTPDWGEGWAEVRGAISAYGYYSEAEALESMSELTRDTVKRIGWEKICHSETPDVIRANFRMIYEELASRRRREAQMPNTLRLMIESAKDKPAELPSEVKADVAELPTSETEAETEGVSRSKEVEELIKKALEELGGRI